MTSIRRRILLPLLPLTALALLITGVGIDATVQRDLEAGLDRMLLTLARSVGAAADLELDGTFEFDAASAPLLGFGTAGRDAFYVVAEPGGTVLAASAGAPAGPFSGAVHEPQIAELVVAGRPFRLCTITVTLKPEDDAEDRREWAAAHPGEPPPLPQSRPVWVTVGHSLEGLHNTQTTLRTRLFVGMCTLFLLLILLPRWAVSRALRPLKRLSAQADAVGPETPRARLTEAGVDREVAALVAALNRALHRLAHALERQQRFTADAAHELRTPLSTMRAHCEVALRKPRTAEELRETVETVHRTGLRLGDLVEGLLTLAVVQTREHEMAETPVELAAIAREALHSHTPAANAKGVHLTAALSAPIPVRGDPLLLLECLSNLIENAVRYTPPGGGVRVGGMPDPQPVVWVEDDGIGISEEHRERIFDRFYRVDPARSRSNGGCGLGLSIAQEIARLHGGEIQVTSRSGKGSRFELRLPACGPALQGVTPQASGARR